MIYLTTDLLNERNEYGDKQRKLVEVPEVGVFYPLVADYSDVRLSLPNKPGGLVPAPDITLCVLRDREHKIYEDFTAEDIFLADKLGSLLSCFAEVAIWAEGVDWNERLIIFTGRVGHLEGFDLHTIRYRLDWVTEYLAKDNQAIKQNIMGDAPQEYAEEKIQRVYGDFFVPLQDTLPDPQNEYLFTDEFLRNYKAFTCNASAWLFPVRITTMYYNDGTGVNRQSPHTFFIATHGEYANVRQLPNFATDDSPSRYIGYLAIKINDTDIGFYPKTAIPHGVDTDGAVATRGYSWISLPSGYLIGHLRDTRKIYPGTSINEALRVYAFLQPKTSSYLRPDAGDTKYFNECFWEKALPNEEGVVLEIGSGYEHSNRLILALSGVNYLLKKPDHISVFFKVSGAQDPSILTLCLEYADHDNIRVFEGHTYPYGDEGFFISFGSRTEHQIKWISGAHGERIGWWRVQIPTPDLPYYDSWDIERNVFGIHIHDPYRLGYNKCKISDVCILAVYNSVSLAQMQNAKLLEYQPSTHRIEGRLVQGNPYQVRITERIEKVNAEQSNLFSTGRGFLGLDYFEFCIASFVGDLTYRGEIPLIMEAL